MSQRTLPLLFFNLGGEMLYILHQRLHAQNVVTGKSAKVMQDMVETMFREQSLDELFQPQPLFSRRGLQMLLQEVAHSSIMRLSNVAMEKLYDLMSMAFKYQLMVCSRPEDIVLVTFNHLDSLKTLVPDSKHCHDMIHTACRKLNEHYSPLSKADFITLRNTMLSLFQDSQKRISVLMRQKLQHQNGTFVIPIDGPIPVGFEIPGTIRYYSEEGEIVATGHFPTAHRYTPPCKQGSWEMVGDRVTTLGLNIYEKDVSTGGGGKYKQRSVSEDRTGRSRSGGSSGAKETRDETQGDVSAAVANVELTLLHRLLVSPQTEKETSFKLNLFPDLELDGDRGDDDNDNDQSALGRETTERNKGNVLHLETDTKGTEDLDKIRQDFTTTDTEPTADEEEDLLDLLDRATAQ